MIFTDILSAIKEAQYLADTEYKTFYLLDKGHGDILVSSNKASGILETVKPLESKK